MSLPTSPRLTPPEYILKMFIMKQSTGASVPTSKYDELVKMYEDKVEEHNQKVYGSQYPILFISSLQYRKNSISLIKFSRYY